jgi:predicted dehydrogenase
MMEHSVMRCLLLAKSQRLSPWIDYLKSCRYIRLDVRSERGGDPNAYDVVVTAETARWSADAAELTQFVRAGGGWLALTDHIDHPVPEIFGVAVGASTAAEELRVLFTDRDHPAAVRLADAVYLKGRHQGLDATTGDSRVLLYADWHYRHSPVLVYRREGEGLAACTTLDAYHDPAFQQILYRVVRMLAGRDTGPSRLGVGLLGYAPSVGRLHGTGVNVTSGLTLRAVCDLDPQRRGQAREDFPGIQTVRSAGELAADDTVDLVVIATPPNSHAQLCIDMMRQGRHVVCEKPLALNRQETDRLESTADAMKVHLSCHQNRRWDPDFLAIRSALRNGLVGELFYMETFVGGFHHPCGYWHSHAPVCGGTAYDWGAHYLDWIIALLPDPVKAVVSTRHKRFWHDVTNADQERIQVRFAGGKEAEFMHSDIAAVRKPKWYLLGTRGAVVSRWKDIAAYSVDPLTYFHRHGIPATEMPPELILYPAMDAGGIAEQKLAEPPREPYAFHRNLADHLLTGEPLAAPLGDSVKVVKLLEAAARSAAKGGTVESIDD